MNLSVHLNVKFRVAFVTLASYSKSWLLAIPLPAGIVQPHTLLHFSQQGVTLDVGLS